LSREVYSIERLDDLAAQARDNLRAAGLDNIVVLVGDGTLGLPGYALYDAIVVAAAAPVVPSALVEQLRDDGRLVQPMGPERERDRLEVSQAWRRAGLGGECGARFVPFIAGPAADLPAPDSTFSSQHITSVQSHPFALGRRIL
jgi:protein-L-isoaspartate(D-aspartate) O-methyltransferase